MTNQYTDNTVYFTFTGAGTATATQAGRVVGSATATNRATREGVIYVCTRYSDGAVGEHDFFRAAGFFRR
jgi:hypothetical protein